MRLLVIGSLNPEVKMAIDIAIKQGAKISDLATVSEAMEFLCEGKGADLILIDVKSEIADLVSKMKIQKIATPVIAYGVNCSPKEGVEAIKSGAKELLPLPPNEKLIAAILGSISIDSESLIGDSSSIQEQINIANKIAPSDAHVLITGASGTGKEVFARYIHAQSKRKDRPFVSVNCAAIPDHLLESELFGHEKGAFTGALGRRIGKFEESSGGTLLLDEISEMDLRLQAKLLRAIQEKEIDRVGGSSCVKIDLRIIATSNRNLEKEIRKGNFREDLYFRLNIINIHLPELKERGEDIISLGEFFIDKYSKNNGIAVKKLSKTAKDKMLHYSWPGNVRELENIMHRSVLLSENNIIDADDLHIKEKLGNGEKPSVTFDEKKMLLNTLGYCLGDINKTANILGITIADLKEKLEFFSKENS